MDHAEYCDYEECEHWSHAQTAPRHNAWHQNIRSSAPVLPGDHDADDCD